MKLSTKHQELLDSLYPGGYKLEKTNPNGGVVDESEYFHILFVKIIPQPGQHENKLVPMIQKLTPQDWARSLQLIEKFGVGGVTQQSEFAVIHDPTVKAEVKEEKTEESEEKKPKSKPGRPPTNK